MSSAFNPAGSSVSTVCVRLYIGGKKWRRRLARCSVRKKVRIENGLQGDDCCGNKGVES
jgi:hypothetical protein